MSFFSVSFSACNSFLTAEFCKLVNLGLVSGDFLDVFLLSLFLSLQLLLDRRVFPHQAVHRSHKVDLVGTQVLAILLSFAQLLFHVMDYLLNVHVLLLKGLDHVFCFLMLAISLLDLSLARLLALSALHLHSLP